MAKSVSSPKKTAKSGKTASKSKKSSPESAQKTSASKKEAPEITTLKKEIVKALEKIGDAEGLAHILEQARVVLYNQEIDTLNALQEKIIRDGKARGSVVDESELTGSKPRHAPITLTPSPSGTSYFLRMSNEEKLLSAEELGALVRVAHSCEAEEAPGNLFRWLKRERSDILFEAAINRPNDPRLDELSVILRKNYRLKRA